MAPSKFPNEGETKESSDSAPPIAVRNQARSVSQLERIATWACLAIVFLVACTLTLGPFISVFEGQTYSLSKTGTGRLIVQSVEPAAFWSDVFARAFLASTAWLLLLMLWKQTANRR